MQLEPSSIACTTLVLPIVMIGLKKKPFAPFSTDPNWKQTQSWLDSPHFSQFLHVSDLLFFNLKSSHCLCKVLPSNLIGRQGYFTFFYIKELNTSQFQGWLLSRKDVFFHLVNVKVHFRRRLEVSLKSICSFRPHKISLFMLWRGSNKGYQDK